MLPIQNPKVETIISLLNEIDVDGETMQHILERVGMEEQMLKQLLNYYGISYYIPILNNKNYEKIRIIV